MDFIEMLKNLGESLADYTVGKYLEEISLTLDNLSEKADDPAKKLAYRMASTKVLELAIEQIIGASEKLPIKKDEDEAE